MSVYLWWVLSWGNLSLKPCANYDFQSCCLGIGLRSLGFSGGRGFGGCYRALGLQGLGLRVWSMVSTHMCRCKPYTKCSSVY